MMKGMENAAKRLYEKYKAAFITGVLCGLWAYAVILFNFVTNSDEILCLRSIGQTIGVGRWLLEIFERVSKLMLMNVTVPAFNGVLAILLLALSGCVASETLELRGRVFPALVTALFVVFPVMGTMMLYIFCVHAFALAVLLIVLGAYVTARRPGLFWLSAVCYCLSMSIYQAYMPLAMSLLMLVVLKRCFSGERLVETVRFVVACLVSFLLGYLLYRGCVEISLRLTGRQLSTYMGVDQMGKLTVNLFDLLCKIYSDVLPPFDFLYGITLTWLVRITLFALYALSAAVFLWLLATAKPGGGNAFQGSRLRRRGRIPHRRALYCADE